MDGRTPTRPHPARRTVLAGAAAGVATAAAAPLLAPTPAAARPRVRRTLARGLQIPWGIAFLPSGDALVSERPTGRLYRVSRTGGKRLVGTVEEAVDFGEGGLLGVAVAPTFRDDRWVYLYYTSSTDNRVVRRRLEDGDLGPAQVLVADIARTYQGSTNHHGGRLAFGPSGHLFITTGDAGRPSRSQRLDSPNGKILRIEPDGTIPADNPFPGSRVWTRGHRNVQGIAWDRRGRMWATELGQSTRDELNRIRKGRNYGWPRVEGGDGDGPFADPFVVWRPTSTCSPSGVAIARGRAWVGALAGESLYSVRLTGPRRGRIVRHVRGRFGRIRTVAEAPDGSLWITTSNGSDDRVVRIEV